MNRLIILGIAVIAVVYIFVSSIFVVNEREQAIVMRFGQITDVKTAPGLYFKIPTDFVDTVQIIEDRLLRYDKSNMSVQVSDGKFYIVDAFATYRISDPRSDIVKSWSRKLSASAAEPHLYSISERIEAVMKREKNLFPNLDFFSASAFHFLGMPTPMFTPIFVFARIAGWAAHILEQRVNRRLIRPTAEYTGPAPRAFVSLRQRG
jgi:hypothetical protein